MMVVFHVLAAAGVAHVAVAPLRQPTQQGVIRRPGVGVVAIATIVGLASHGVLDGLPHGYHLGALTDIGAGGTLAAAWCLAVRRPLRLLFAVVIAAALLPDVIDHGGAMLRWQAGLSVPVRQTPVFPWHWPEGSGSLYGGRHATVSLVNHFVVLTVAAGCVLTSLWAFRFAPNRPPL